ncbi:Rho GTPase-activating protein 25 [Echinococcus granulosus]|uniref:Rho GTPase-activating protein n=1 Tax=Echinococcus granulosus TaxID=6210 RepID=W6U6V4_ECHGR|nr:Rho GTPase-activating protein [Echinococcus granulosus]EUB54097.1 Rho GTPase-activating protein [Echinococcus granulosus]KAH9281485.1 Rho GTPase-activating protein 25 [Echinococcus granulosus]
MERLRKAFLGTNRSSELDSALPLYCTTILASVEEVRPHIHDYRKQLEKNTTLFSTSWGKLDSRNICKSCPFWILMKTQEELVGAQHKFMDGSVKQLIANLRSWEEECSQVLKVKTDLQKALIDLNRVKEKQRPGRENESAQSLISYAESIYTNHRVTLLNELSRYVQSEANYQEKVKKFLGEQVSFLDTCKEKVDRLWKSIGSTSAFAGEAPSRSYFGSRLQEHLDEEGFSVVLKKCLSYLMKSEAYTREGIFRLAGQVTYIQLLRTAIDMNKVDDSLLDLCGVYVVADVMKQYLRELPKPLLSCAFVENFSGKKLSSSEIISLMKAHLPEANWKNFLLLLHFLLKVCQNEATSKMSADNLALTLWINLCPKTSISEGANIVKYLLTHAEDLVTQEGILNILESLPNATIVTAPLKAIQTAHRGQKLERSCPQRPDLPEVSLRSRLPPQPPTSNAPNYSPQASVNETRNPSVTNKQSGSVEGVSYQQHYSLTLNPVTTFDNSEYRRAISESKTNTEKRGSKTSSLLPPTPTSPLPSSGTFVGHERPVALESGTELPRREGTPSQPKEKGEEKEDESSDESEKTTSSENSTSTETSTTDSSTEVVSKHNRERKNRNGVDESKKKKEELGEAGSGEPLPKEHSKTKGGEKKGGKCYVKMRSDGTSAQKKSSSSDEPAQFITRKQELNMKHASSGSGLESKGNISD